MSLDTKIMLIEALKQGSEQLKKGNYEGWNIIRRTCESIFFLVDDEDTIYLTHILLAIATSFFEAQVEKENGKVFLEKIGEITAEMAEAYQSGNSKEIDSLGRKFFVALRNRWKKSPMLARERKEK